MNTYIILNGYPVQIDSDDVGSISKYTWIAVKGATENRQGRVYFHRYIGTINGKQTRQYLHRFLLDCPTGEYVDHINRDTLDCRKVNLRICDHHTNMVNRSMQSNNTSGTIGVGWCDSRKAWRAKITINKKVIELGYFKKLDSAITARKVAEGMYGYDKIRVAV